MKMNLDKKKNLTDFHRNCVKSRMSAAQKTHMYHPMALDVAAICRWHSFLRHCIFTNVQIILTASEPARPGAALPRIARNAEQELTSCAVRRGSDEKKCRVNPARIIVEDEPFDVDCTTHLRRSISVGPSVSGRIECCRRMHRMHQASKAAASLVMALNPALVER